jgi:sodium-dependent dicarboxylate transporter 2/3/5
MNSRFTGFSNRKYTGLIIGFLLFLFIILFTELEPGKPEITRTCAIAVLMATWWVTEAIPLSVTALLPVVLFPLLGVLDGKDISTAYFNHIIFIFIGGFIMALAMEKWNLHKRIALKILLWVGVSPGRILLGCMLATSLLSMWISNTATAMMMIPIVTSIIIKIEESLSKKELSRYATGLLLGIAYSASIGGIATIVGTPPNLICVRMLNILFADAPEILFNQWLLFAFPLTVAMFIIVWLILKFSYVKKIKTTNLSRESIKSQYESIGKSSYEEKIVFILFILLALLWITRPGFKFNSFSIPGWSLLFKHSKYINDGTVAVFIAVILFIIPARSDRSKRLMDWKTANRIPWNIVILFGGGFALAMGFEKSGLSLWLANQLAGGLNVNPLVYILMIVGLMTFLTELTSNTASTQMLLPVFASIAVGLKINPMIFMVPVTLAASFAFMLPTATPPNAIIFGTDRVSINNMIRTGFVINIVGILIVTMATYVFLGIVFNIEPFVLPEWAITQ